MAGEFVVEGAIGGAGTCRYADTYAIQVASGDRVVVEALEPGGSVCADSALTQGYELELRDATLLPLVAGMTDASGCAAVQTGALAGGMYFLSVTLPAELDRAVPYQLRVSAAP